MWLQRQRKFYLVTSLSEHENVKMMATELLVRGDMIATDSMYHLKCMNAFRSKYKLSIRRRNANQEREQEQVAEARALSKLMSYIESSVEKYFSAIKNLRLIRFSAKRSKCH